MPSANQAVTLIETAYRNLERDSEGWLTELRRVASGALPDAEWVSVSEIAITPSSFTTIGLAADAERRSSHAAWHASASPELLASIYLEGPVSRVRPLVAGTEWVGALEAQGIHDIVGAVGLDPGGRGTVLTYGTRAAGLPRSRRHLLGRLAAHLAAASRLRLHGDGDVGEAVCASDGRVLHAEGRATEPRSRAALREAARRIDRARSRGTSPEDGVEMWNALVEGRWSLVERFESDGRRLFVARANLPTMRPSAALDEAERAVVALAALGRPQKLIAYELGRSEASVSQQLRRAMGKLGVRGRAALVEVHGALVGRASGSPA